MKIDELHANAEAGSVPAQSVLGIAYLHGYEVPQDYVKAFRWLSLAASRGASRSCAWLGTMFENGLTVPIDLARARELYEYAASRDEFWGHLLLARFLASGKSGHVDVEGATRAYKNALRGSFGDSPEIQEANAWFAAHPDAKGK